MTNVVRPRIAWFIASRISCSVSGSIAAVGSSSISTGGSSRIARAIAIRCRCPPDRFAPLSVSSVSYPLGRSMMKSWAQAIFAAFSICSRVAVGWPNAMFAATVLLKRKLSWNTIPMFRRRSSTSYSRRSTPSSFTRPTVGS